MPDQLDSSIVRLLGADGTIVGVGLLTQEKCVLTCADMVARALGIPLDMRELPAGEVHLDFPLFAPGRHLTARVVFWQPSQSGDATHPKGAENLAFLKLESAIPEAEAPQSAKPPESHYDDVRGALRDGELIPFLGAGVNLCGRPKDRSWRRGEYLPSGSELAAYLAQQFSYPWGEAQDLVRVSQYVALMRGSGPLYRKLHQIFDANYPPTPLHKFLASIPDIMRRKGYAPSQLIVTTNYDDLLESAFRDASEPFDLVSYVAEG